MNFISQLGGWLFLIIGLAISIGLHELGHMWPAKAFGVKVTRYMIGFGPTLFSRKRGDTEYGIKAIPLGGYIQMVGMVPPLQPAGSKKNFWQRITGFAQPTEQPAIDPEDEGKTFYQLAPWKKLIIMFGGPFANLLIAMVLALALFSGFGAYERTTTVHDIVACIPSDANPNCDTVGSASPAAKAGLLAGDKILMFNQVRVSKWSDLDSMLAKSIDQRVSLVVMRAGQEISIEITPVKITIGGTTKAYLGVYLESARFQQSIPEAFGQLGSMLVGTGDLILKLPNQAISALSEIVPGAPRDSQGAISIIGLGQFSGEIASNQDISLLDKVLSQLGMLMSLNVALFVFNMIPLVPLDGGHIAGAVYESIKRGVWRLRGKKLERPVDTSQMTPIAYFVASLLLVLTLVLILRDIFNPLHM